MLHYRQSNVGEYIKVSEEKRNINAFVFKEISRYCHVWTLPRMQGLLNEYSA